MLRFILVSLAAAVAGCYTEGFDDTRMRVDEFACYDARDAVVAAWSEALWPVSDRCLDFAGSYAVSMVPSADIDAECGIKQANLAGCARHDTHDIIVAADFGELRNDLLTFQANVAVHEWAHVIAYCELGDPDSGHADRVVWGEVADIGLDYQTELESVVGLARSRTTVGPCLTP